MKRAFFRLVPRLFLGCSLIGALPIYNKLIMKPYYQCQESDLQSSKFEKDEKKMGELENYLFQKQLKRFYLMENANRKHKSFYHDGIRVNLDCFEKYEIYTFDKTIEKYEHKNNLLPHEKEQFGALFLLFRTNPITQGHKNISHGGLIATIIDHFMGRVSDMVSDGENVATASLTVNYKKPILVGKDYLVEVRFEKIEKERKIYLKAKILNEKLEICNEAEALFLKVKWGKT